MADQYKILEQRQAFNSALAATATETVINGTLSVDFYNHLEVLNTDAVKIRIRLDRDSTRVYFVEAKTGFILPVEEGQQFRSVEQINEDAAAAETANTILFKAMYKVKV